jgi:hypothetical protein
MLIRPPRWVLVTEGVVVLCAVAVLAYKAAMWVRPLGRIDQAQFLPKVDPKTRINEYYVRYPESYIRLSKESWQYDSAGGTAHHKFTLANRATVRYDSIRIELTYQSSAGKTLHCETISLPGTLEASGSMEISGLEVKHVPPASETVLIRVIGAHVDTGVGPR